MNKEPKADARVTIHYFKPASGKWVTTDENVLWPADPGHWSGYKPFRDILRLHHYVAVCLETPLGHPVSAPPQYPHNILAAANMTEAIALMNSHVDEVMESVAELHGKVAQLLSAKA